jgi:iron complex outermembrane receptor protein
VDDVDITATNKSLQPENINSHTVLLEHAFNSRLHVAASGFSNSLNNVIKEQVDANNNTHFANEIGDTGRGAEAELIAKYPSGWLARTSYTFVSTRQKQTGTTVMNSPAHVAKFNGVAPITRSGFVAAEFLFTGSEPNFLNQRIPSSFLVNATVSTRTFANGLQLSASCYNVLDRSWATPTGPEVEAPATVQDGRTWRFRLTYRRNFERKWAAK